MSRVSEEENKSIPSAWSIRNFRLYTYAGILMPFAAQIQSLIVGWQVYEIKHDPLYLGLIGLTEAAPGLSMALISGYIVDRSNPLKVYKNVVRLALLSSLMLFLISGSWLGLTPEKKVPFLYLAAFLAGLGRGFSMPSRTALVPQLVPREVLHISSAWSTSAFNIATAMGPALGGFLYAWKGPQAPYLSNCIVLVAALVLLAGIEFTPRRNLISKSISGFKQITAGLSYVFSDQLLLSALGLDMFAVLFGGAVALLPVFAADILKVGPTGLGILRAAPSLGALLGSMVMIRFPPSRHSGRLLLAVVTGFGFCMIGFGISKTFWISALLLGLGGGFDSVSVVIRNTIVQLTAPPEMRGRVGAVNSIFIGVSNQLGEFESGVAAKLMGTAPSVLFGGALTLIVVAVVGFAAPKLRRMELSKL